MEKLAKHLTLKYTLLQCAFWVSQCIIFSFAAVYLHSKNFNNTQIGLVLSAASVFSVLLQPLIGGFADRTEKISLRVIHLVLMFVVFGCGILLLIIPDTFLLISSCYIIIIAIQFTLSSLMNSLVMEYINMGIPVNYGLSRGISSLAFAAVSFMLGIATVYFSGDIILGIFLASYVILIYFTWNFKISIPDNLVGIVHKEYAISDEAVVEPLHNNENRAGLFRFFIKYKKFSLYLIGVTMIFYSHNVTNSYLINIMEHLGGDSSDMGTALSIAATLELPVMAAFIFITRKFKCSTLIKFSSLFFTIKSAVTWLAPSVSAVLFSMFFQMFAFAIFTPASIFYVNKIVDSKDRIKGQTMLGVANQSLAVALGGITGGKILDSLGVSDMLLLGTIVTAIGFVILCISTESTPLEER